MASIIRGTENLNYLQGSSENDYLYGMGGNDSLAGSPGNDTLVGGAGNDTLVGGAGDDTYFFSRGDGKDLISREASLVPERNVLRLGDNISPADIVLSRTGNDGLTLSLRASDDSITIEGYFSPGVDGSSGQTRWSAVSDIRFADGSGWDRTAVFGKLNPVKTLFPGADYFQGVNLDGGAGNDMLSAAYADSQLAGGEGNDTLQGGDGNDLLVGGAGDDRLAGGAGVNTYRFNGDWGHDTLAPVMYGTRMDVIELPGLLSAALRFQRSGDGKDLLIGVKDGTQSIAVANYFSSPDIAAHLRFVLADGSNLGVEQVWHDMGNLNGLQLTGTDADDQLTGAAANDLLIGGKGNDTLNGGSGNDILVGGEGADFLFDTEGNNLFDAGAGDARLRGGSGVNLYKFGRAAGTYTLDPGLQGVHIVLLDDDVRPADVSVVAYRNESLRFAINGSAALLQLPPLRDSDVEPGTRVRVQLRFADGTFWSEDDILNQAHRGDARDNVIRGSQGLDVLQGLDGNDTLDGYRGDDTVYGGNGDDSLDGGDGNDVLLGGAGRDQLFGGEGNDYLQGQDGNDRLLGGIGNDTLRGGAGDDDLWESDGSNTFVFAAGDGNDVLHVSQGQANQNNAIVFEGGIKPQDVWVSLVGTEDRGSHLVLESGTDRVTVLNYDSAYSRYPVVNEIRFADGTVWNKDAIVVRSLIGNASDNLLNGGNGNDVLEGKGGNDTLLGGEGNDTLAGGPGMDVLNGGNDDANTYLLGRGDGQDVIPTWSAGSVIRFGEGIGAADLRGTAAPGSTLRLDYGTDSVVIGQNVRGEPQYVLEHSYVEFADRTRVPLSSFINHAPVLLYTPAPQVAQEGQPFSVVLPVGMFADPDRNDSGVMSVTGLPAWLGFDPASRTLFGVPAQMDAGSVPLSVTWTDKGGLRASTTMALNVLPAASVTLYGGAEADILAGKSNHDDLHGLAGDDQLYGMAGNDRLDGGAGNDTLAGGSGNDSYLVDAFDVVLEDAAAGLDQVTSPDSLALADNVEMLTLSGTAPVDGSGNALDNLLKGNAGANLLQGGEGSDLLQGGDGNDRLVDTSGSASLLDGGTGDDQLQGGDGNDMFIGGAGADLIVTGSGADLIVFNRGDGIDTVAGTPGAGTTLSLGGGIVYADLLLSKSGHDLILTTGATDQLIFKNWYGAPGNASVGTLQVVTAATWDYHPGALSAINDNKVEQFDFSAIVARFDDAVAGGASAWSAWTTLEQFVRGGSDTAAIGADLAYQYALNGNLANVGMTPALAIIGSSGFGSAAQDLSPDASLSDGSPLLY
ncbi:MAG TPA: calcium-binding protein [Telluria sp.]|jgi:Ca2+-binding RTX toxin-like protein